MGRDGKWPAVLCVTLARVTRKLSSCETPTIAVRIARPHHRWHVLVDPHFLLFQKAPTTRFFFISCHTPSTCKHSPKYFNTPPLTFAHPSCPPVATRSKRCGRRWRSLQPQQFRHRFPFCRYAANFLVHQCLHFGLLFGDHPAVLFVTRGREHEGVDAATSVRAR